MPLMYHPPSQPINGFARYSFMRLVMSSLPSYNFVYDLWGQSNLSKTLSFTKNGPLNVNYVMLFSSEFDAISSLVLIGCCVII